MTIVWKKKKHQRLQELVDLKNAATAARMHDMEEIGFLTYLLPGFALRPVAYMERDNNFQTLDELAVAAFEAFLTVRSW